MDAPLPTFEPQALGASVFTLAALVAFIVQFVKKQLERQGWKMPWWVTLLVALIVAEGLSALLFYAGYGARFGNTPPPMTWILFGLVAAAAGAGGRDLLMSFAERGKTDVVVSAPAEERTDPTPDPPAAPINPNATIIIERPGDVPLVHDPLMPLGDLMAITER